MTADTPLEFSASPRRLQSQVQKRCSKCVQDDWLEKT